jgi:1A family penicillin-binding protein
MSRKRYPVGPAAPRRAPQSSTAWRAVFIPLVMTLAAALIAGSLYPLLRSSSQALQKFNATFLKNEDEKLEIGAFPERSTIYANDGSPLATVADYNRIYVPLEKIAPVARDAVLAIEDDTFYKHGPVNVLSILRAAIANLKAGKVVQGGSTITLQLVGSTYQQGDQSLSQKIREAQDAIRLERTYTKDHILELYMNDVYFGNGTYGIEAASEYYFNRHASELNLQQAALLAGLIKAPADYDPVKYPDLAAERRNIVLLRMRALDWISDDDYQKALTRPVKLSSKNRSINNYGTSPTAYFTSYVVERLLDSTDKRYAALGDTEKERSRSLYQGGLKIYTTVMPQWQQYAATAVTNMLPNQGPQPPADPQAALVSIDPANGAIRAMYGGKDYSKQKINLATQSRRQTGSAFKVFTLVAALEQGVPIGKVYPTNSPTTIPEDKCPNPGGPWQPTNAEPGNGGFENMRDATAHSVNVWFAQLIADVGPSYVAEAAKRMGVRGPNVSIPEVCSITLGSVEVNPLAMTSGVATLANDGTYCRPFAIRKIVSRTGKVLYSAKPSCKQVVAPDIAATVTSLLEGVIQFGTGQSHAPIGRPAAGKTGTGTDNKDAWFMGYIPQLATGVWVGYSKKAYEMSSLRVLGGGAAFGGVLAAPIWHDFMIRAVAGMPVKGFPAPMHEQGGNVPNVVGLMKDEAIKVLTDANFTPFVTVVDAVEPKDTVVTQTPGAGASAILGSRVTIEVSSGVVPKGKVPGVVGLSLATARSRVEAAGFVVKVTYQDVSDKSQDGVVLSQDPKGNSSRDQGTTVTLVVGRFVEPSPSPSPSPGG